jgi:hypothetical protein
LVLSAAQAASPARRSGALDAIEHGEPTMPVTEHERHQLFSWFEEHLGSERAATLMSLLPPVGWGDVATRRDLDEQVSAVRRDVDVVRRDVELLRDELRSVEKRLDASIDLKLDAKLGLLRGELLRTFGTWLFASQAVVIATVSLIVALD